MRARSRGKSIANEIRPTTTTTTTGNLAVFAIVASALKRSVIYCRRSPPTRPTTGRSAAIAPGRRCREINLNGITIIIISIKLSIHESDGAAVSSALAGNRVGCLIVWAGTSETSGSRVISRIIFRVIATSTVGTTARSNNQIKLRHKFHKARTTIVRGRSRLTPGSDDDLICRARILIDNTLLILTAPTATARHNTVGASAASTSPHLENYG